MTPDATLHNPGPTYLRGLIKVAGLTQNQAARKIGVSERSMRYYLAGQRECPYPVQFCLESLAKVAVVREPRK